MRVIALATAAAVTLVVVYLAFGGASYSPAKVADPALVETRVSWVSPGDSARIVKVLDAVEPRTKGRGGGGIFPGFLGPAKAQGRGETHVLRGAAVIAAG